MAAMTGQFIKYSTSTYKQGFPAIFLLKIRSTPASKFITFVSLEGSLITMWTKEVILVSLEGMTNPYKSNSCILGSYL